MRFPDTESLIVPKAKVVKYLLSASHPVGQGKARWFERHGFTAGHWQILAERLRDHAVENEIEATEESPFGIRYIIEGPLKCPDGQEPAIRAIWFVETDETSPRFVTAYPLKRSVR